MFIQTMEYVTIMKLVMTIVLSLFGITPAWCDACGEMYRAEDMTYSESFGHYTEESGYICPYCWDYWM